MLINDQQDPNIWTIGTLPLNRAGELAITTDNATDDNSVDSLKSLDGGADVGVSFSYGSGKGNPDSPGGRERRQRGLLCRIQLHYICGLSENYYYDSKTFFQAREIVITDSDLFPILRIRSADRLGLDEWQAPHDLFRSPLTLAKANTLHLVLVLSLTPTLTPIPTLTLPLTPVLTLLPTLILTRAARTPHMGQGGAMNG